MLRLSTTTKWGGRSMRSLRTSMRSSARWGPQAITEFGIDVSRLHWGTTSISLVGDSDSPEAGFIAPSYGKPKDRRVDRKQVQTGLAVTGDGGIPVFHRAYDGKAGEINQVAAAIEAGAGELRAMAVAALIQLLLYSVFADPGCSTPRRPPVLVALFAR
jgi:transposase